MLLIKIRAREGVPKVSCGGNLMRPRVRYSWRWGSVSKGKFCAQVSVQGVEQFSWQPDVSSKHNKSRQPKRKWWRTEHSFVSEFSKSMPSGWGKDRPVLKSKCLSLHLSNPNLFLTFYFLHLFCFQGGGQLVTEGSTVIRAACGSDGFLTKKSTMLSRVMISACFCWRYNITTLRQVLLMHKVMW